MVYIKNTTHLRVKNHSCQKVGSLFYKMTA